MSFKYCLHSIEQENSYLSKYHKVLVQTFMRMYSEIVCAYKPCDNRIIHSLNLAESFPHTDVLIHDLIQINVLIQ